MLATWEKILEYASMPVHGTMSRKLRKGVRLQINEGPIFEKAIFFLSDTFLRMTEDGDGGEKVNTYYDLSRITSIRTYSPTD
jgi:hypothetical protein